MKYQFILQKPIFAVENIDILKVSRPNGYKHSYNYGRTKHAFLYVVSGRMCNIFHTGEKRTVYADAGDLIFIPEGSVYTGTYLGDNAEVKIIQFDLSYGTLPDYLSFPQKIEMSNTKEMIDRFFNHTKKRTPNHPFYYLSYLYALLYQVDEEHLKIPKKYKKIKPALNEIAEKWNVNEPISHYASLCDMSEVNFRKLFREFTGMSPVEYRNDIRLTYAKNKLQSGEYNVSEAAYESGFSNLSFFIRLYKKKFGYTPKKDC